MNSDMLAGETNIILMDRNFKILDNHQYWNVDSYEFRAERWSTLAFILGCRIFRHFEDEHKIYNDMDIKDGHVRCEIVDTKERFPKMYDFIKEYKYYSNKGEVNGTKVFSIEVLREITVDFKLQVIIPDLVEAHRERECADKDESYLIAFHNAYNDYWEIVLVYKQTRYPQTKSGDKLLAMGRDYIAIEIHSPKLLSEVFNEGFNLRDLGVQRHFIKLRKQ